MQEDLGEPQEGWWADKQCSCCCTMRAAAPAGVGAVLQLPSYIHSMPAGHVAIWHEHQESALVRQSDGDACLKVGMAGRECADGLRSVNAGRFQVAAQLAMWLMCDPWMSAVAVHVMSLCT
jgi:hypothetical protein